MCFHENRITLAARGQTWSTWDCSPLPAPLPKSDHRPLLPTLQYFCSLRIFLRRCQLVLLVLNSYVIGGVLKHIVLLGKLESCRRWDFFWQMIGATVLDLHHGGSLICLRCKKTFLRICPLCLFRWDNFLDMQECLICQPLVFDERWISSAHQQSAIISSQIEISRKKRKGKVHHQEIPRGGEF